MFASVEPCVHCGYFLPRDGLACSRADCADQLISIPLSILSAASNGGLLPVASEIAGCRLCGITSEFTGYGRDSMLLHRSASWCLGG
ncbi:hypothetical protein J2T09_002889 [Neorhizobium huautlense]|uniref:Uncharacterized protein n=1 Tax=Neorhizobium huautlense TaxID=67774 RepID=A0ABT9PUH1_9HYPH|nr:hypothetical protein [Neorhizobium huautlense]